MFATENHDVSYGKPSRFVNELWHLSFSRAAFKRLMASHGGQKIERDKFYLHVVCKCGGKSEYVIMLQKIKFHSGNLDEYFMLKFIKQSFF